MPDKKLLNFPCQFPIKVFGASGDDFEAEVVSIIRKYVTDIPEGAFKLNASKKGNYTALTVTITATSQKQLDNIYMELTRSKQVIMAL